jgi:uncharacterized protein (DUF2062 family)
MADFGRLIGRFIKRNSPSREEVLESRWLRPFGSRIRQSDLWRFTRRSVPRGAAIGLFVGIFLMIPGLQIVGAALASAPLRGNIPIAAAMTFLSNPATTPFFLVAAINLGNRMGFHADMATFDALVESHASFGQWMSWVLSDAAPAMITGLLVIGAAVAFVGYWVAMVGWRWWVGRKWKRRNPVQS